MSILSKFGFSWKLQQMITGKLNLKQNQFCGRSMHAHTVLNWML